jgi:uncharacterized protein YndB with AHSA1/START domain
MASKPEVFGAIHLSTRAAIAQAMVRMEQAGEGFRLPLIRAAVEGELSAVAVMHGAPVPTRYLELSRPTVISYCDDHPDATGPGRWKQVRRLLRWANAAVLHATGGQAEHYALIAATTIAMKRVLLIEMQQCHHAAWRALVNSYAPRLKAMSIVPPPGDCHPRMTAPAGTVMQ